MKYLIFTLFVFASACGQAPADLAGGAPDKCFNLRGTWDNGADTLKFGDAPGQAFAYCYGRSTRCDSDFYVKSENPDLSYALSLYSGTYAMGLPPHAECPTFAETDPAGHATCRFDVSGDDLTMDCGHGAVAYRRAGT